MRIVHIITSLSDGGAENILYKICQYDKLNEHIVISILNKGKYFSLLKKRGINVYCMNMRFYSLINFFVLIFLLRSLKPDIVQTWLIHGDIIGSIASRLAGIKNILWTVLYSKLDTSFEKKRNILLIKILAKLSNIFPKLVLVNSKSGKINCLNLGYNKKKLKLIYFGIDLSNFKINDFEKKNFRKKNKIKKQTYLIASIARFHPVKDHLNLLNALSIVRLKNKKFCCLLVGSGMTRKNKILFNEIKRLKLEKNIKLLGSRNDISQIMNAIDVNILCSKSEGFPNVIVESMACGTPCIVTNVGDSAYIVGKTGWVVPSQNSKKLATAIEKAIFKIGKKNWKEHCNQASSRVTNNFNILKRLKFYNSTLSKVYNKSY